MSQSNSEAQQSIQNYSGTFSTGGNQYLGNTFNLTRGDIHFNSQIKNDEEGWLRFLRSLRYERIDERKNTIKEHQHLTFEWALEDTSISNCDKCPLPDWLRNGQGTFLVQGKPGAGKSTLMKFLIEDERTKSLLRQSFNSENVLVLFHSFWCLGQDELQHNWKGLLCSLTLQLAELLRSSATKLSTRYVLKETVHDWSERELHHLLFRLIEDSKTAFCIFIDGLDELNHGDLDKIYDFMDNLTGLTSTKCKVCLASRPMPDVESMNITSTIKIQDYTAKDIRRHVTEVLATCSRFEKRIQAGTWEEKTESITDTICAKAEGVFLWVEYVLQSVRKGLRIADNLDIIEKRISTLPSEIGQLYRHMLMLHQGDMDANAEEVALLFGLSEYLPISLAQLAIACNTRVRNIYLESGWLQKLGKGRLHDFASDFHPRLNILSAGLLEYESRGRPKNSVRFIHRSAQDYLQNEKTLPHLAFTDGIVRQKDVLQAYVQSYLICLIENEFRFHDGIFSRLVRPLIQSDFADLRMLETVDHVCSLLFRQIRCRVRKKVLPNWIAYIVAKRPSLRFTDLPGLIVSNNPSPVFWNQFMERHGAKWSRYYKGYLLTLAAEAFMHFDTESRTPSAVITSLLNAGADMSGTQLVGIPGSDCLCGERSASVTILCLFVWHMSRNRFSIEKILSFIPTLEFVKDHISVDGELTVVFELHFGDDDQSRSISERIESLAIESICVMKARRLLDLVEIFLEGFSNLADKLASRCEPQLHDGYANWFAMCQYFNRCVADGFYDVYIYFDDLESSPGEGLIPCPDLSKRSVAHAFVSGSMAPEHMERIVQSFLDLNRVCISGRTRVADLAFPDTDRQINLWTIDPMKNVNDDNWSKAYTFYRYEDFAHELESSSDDEDYLDEWIEELQLPTQRNRNYMEN